MGPVLTRRQQGIVVVVLGAVALGLTILVSASGQGRSQPNSIQTRYVPSAEQLRSFAAKPVSMRIFRTEIIADGYVSANGKGASGVSLPVLPAQASDMLQAENDLVAARAQYRNSSAAEDRQHKLYDSAGAPLKDWQQSQADLATVASALASARNKVRLLGKSDDGGTGAFTVGDNSSVWLIANVREADAGQIAMGNSIRADVPGFEGQTVSGRVAFIASVVDPSTHRLAVGALVRNPGGLLKPNMLATLSILAGAAHTGAAVPEASIIHDGTRTHVWVVGPKRTLSFRAVATGLTDGGFVEITAGLKPGEQVATAGGLFIDQAMAND